VLYHDEYWRELLEFARDHGGYRGCECSLLDMHEQGDVNALLDAIAHESLLGRASAQNMYPTDLDRWFDDSPWRVLL
jgi:hypothetical protein